MILLRLKIILPIFLFVLFSKLNAQIDSLKKWSFSAYGELYYSYDFSKPANNEKPNFIYNHKRHNELNVNLLLAKVAYLDSNFRSNVGLMIGNYAKYNLASEPKWAQLIYEANIGVRLSKKKNIWLDGGILPSHIGFESAISADCQTLTRSLLAENSPYYESGLRFSHTGKKEKWYLAVLALNGWQKINFTNGYNKFSSGAQITYKPNPKTVFNFSSFVGSNKPDSLNSIRSFANLYFQRKINPKWDLTLGFDLGIETLNDSTDGYWYSPVAILVYHTTTKINLALRTEYYSDKNQIIIPTLTANGFQVFGSSLNFDYKIDNLFMVRIEAKMYHSKDVIFSNNSKNNYSLTSNLTIRL